MFIKLVRFGNILGKEFFTRQNALCKAKSNAIDELRVAAKGGIEFVIIALVTGASFKLTFLGFLAAIIAKVYVRNVLK